MGALSNVITRIKALITADNKQFKKKMKETTQVTKKTGMDFKKMGQMIAGSMVVVGILKFGKAMLNIGKSLDLMNIKATAVFGLYKKEVMAMADETASSMGMTKTEFVNTAAGIQDLLIPIGFARKEATGMTKDMMGLAGALSTWTGGTISATQVGNIFAKAMLGEREELKSLGISLSEAEIQTELLARGQKKLTGTALAQAKAQVTLDLITSKSTDAQKAFSEAQDSLVVTMAQTGSNIRSMGESIAVILTPAMNKGAGAAEKLTGRMAEMLGIIAISAENNMASMGDKFIAMFGHMGLSGAQAAAADLNTEFARTAERIKNIDDMIARGVSYDEQLTKVTAYGADYIKIWKKKYSEWKKLSDQEAAEAAFRTEESLKRDQAAWAKRKAAYEKMWSGMAEATQAFHEGLALTTSAAEMAAMETTKLGIATYEAGVVMDTIPEKGALAAMGIGVVGQTATSTAEQVRRANIAMQETTFVGQAMGMVMNEVMWSIVDASSEAGASFADMARAAGRAAKKAIGASIATGVAAAASKALAGAPFPLNMILAPLAGAAASALFSSLIPSFAAGGLVTGPTLAMVGDNPSGKEAIIPSEMWGQMGGNDVNVGGVLQGHDFYLMNKRYGEKLSRTGRV